MDEDKISRLKAIADLRDSGILSEKEFKEQKEKIMQAPTAPGYPQQYPQPPHGGGQQQYSGQGDPPMEGGIKTLLYIVSFLFPIAGVIFGVIYIGKPEPWHKEFGKTCLQLALLSFIVGIVLFFLSMGAMFASF
jgi:hypothetical protein